MSCNFCNSCNPCGCTANFPMPQFEIVSPCCFRPRGGIFLIRQKNCGCGCRNARSQQNDDRWEDRDRGGDCGCQRGNR